MAGNPLGLSLWTWCAFNLRRDLARPSIPVLEQCVFRVSGKRAKWPAPVDRFPQHDVDGKVETIARMALRLWFLLGLQDTADNDDLILITDENDARYYGRQGRRFLQELVSNQSFYHSNRAERDHNASGRKGG